MSVALVVSFVAFLAWRAIARASRTRDDWDHVAARGRALRDRGLKTMQGIR